MLVYAVLSAPYFLAHVMIKACKVVIPSATVRKKRKYGYHLPLREHVGKERGETELKRENSKYITCPAKSASFSRFFPVYKIPSAPVHKYSLAMRVSWC